VIWRVPTYFGVFQRVVKFDPSYYEGLRTKRSANVPITVERGVN
jgi:hypothetical protein